MLHTARGVFSPGAGNSFYDDDCKSTTEANFALTANDREKSRSRRNHNTRLLPPRVRWPATLSFQ